MKLTTCLLATALGAKTKEFDKKAERMCNDYLTGKGADADKIEFKYIAAGAQGAIYRCQVDDESITPNDTALKLYFNDDTMNMTKLKEMDMQLTAQGLRYPVYDWVGSGKFEQFLVGKRDLEIADFANPDLRSAVARQFARLHGGVVNNINKKEYRQAGKGWWNTYEVKAHFDVMFWLMDNNLFPGKTEELYELTRMDKDSLNKEILWAQQQIQDYYGDNEDSIVMCHNDLHPGNVMVNKEGDFDPTQLVFIDYDNAGYGYRAFDLIYNMMNWPFEKDPESQYRWYNTFLTDYVDERKKLGDTAISMEQMHAEMFTHTPYMILEKMVFAVAFGFGEEEFITAMGYLYADEARKRNHTIKYSSLINNDTIVSTTNVNTTDVGTTEVSTTEASTTELTTTDNSSASRLESSLVSPVLVFLLR